MNKTNYKKPRNHKCYQTVRYGGWMEGRILLKGNKDQ